ncbi:MAG TPA: hypothetical protein VEV81_09345 [Pyrinomonadaceae bacterium]|nr:hypothetical protein [Pyrinomonadaceae bacterium]
MKIATNYLIIVALGLYVLACSAPSPSKDIEQAKPAPLGDYQYTGYDKNGGKLVEGRLSITSSEQKRIYSEEVTQLKGNWQLEKVGDQERIGGQVGTGDLIGSINKGEIYINLNPNIADANVILRGKLEGRRFHGTWSFNGYAGPLNQGTFEALRK